MAVFLLPKVKNIEIRGDAEVQNRGLRVVVGEWSID